MKKSKFTEAQIVFALQQAESGVTVAEVCRKLGISEATFYSWKKKFSGLGPAELRRLRQLEEENAQLKRLVADLTLDKQMLQDVLKKSSEGTAAPATRGHAAGGVSRLGATRLRDCILHRSVYRYVDNPRDDRPVRQRLKEIAETRVRYGFQRTSCYAVKAGVS